MIVDAAGDDLCLEVLEVGSDQGAGDGVAAADELVAGVIDDIGMKVACEMGRVAVVQGLERAVHHEGRTCGHRLIVLGGDERRVGNASRCLAVSLAPRRLRGFDGLVVTRLVEREQELEVLQDALAVARAGEGRVIVVEAPAGCGKTALLSAAKREALGFRSLTGRGGELERAAGFGVVRDLYGGAVSADAANRMLEGAAQLVKPLLMPDSSAGSTLDAAVLYHGLYWLTANLATEHPLLLAVDDAQWADVASLRFLEYLAARLDAIACVMLLAWRSGEPGSDEGFVGRILGVAQAIHVAPMPLSRTGARTLIRSRVPAGVTDELLDRCHAASAGNPFLLHELAGAISRTSSGDEQASVLDWLAEPAERGASDGPPERLIRIVRARLSRLPEPAGAVASALAVLGPGAALRHAAGIAGVSSHDAARGIDALAAADLIRPRARIEFVHPLLRRAIYDMQPPAWRAEAHERAARLLAAEDADSEVVAGHLLAGPAGGDHTVVAALMTAADTALNRGAPAAAVTYLRRALDEPPGPDDRARVLRALGNAQVQTGERDAIVNLREAHARCNDAPQRLEIALEIAHAAMGLGPSAIEDVIKELPAALAESDDLDDDRNRETAMLAHTLLLGATVPTARPQWRAFAGPSRRLYDHVADGLGRRGLAAALAFAGIWSNQPADAVRALALHALGDDEDYDQTLAAGWQMTWSCVALAVGGEWRLAERRLAQAITSGQQRGSQRVVRNALWARLAVRALSGDLTGAESDGRQALELHDDPTRHPVMLVMFAFHLVDVLLDRRGPQDAQALLDQLAIDDSERDAIAPQMLCARSRLRLAQRRPAEAAADADIARQILAHAELDPVAFFSVHDRAASALAALGRHGEARHAADRALALAHASGARAPIGVALRTSALLHRGPQQIRGLSEAADALEDSGRSLEFARTLIELGAAMRRQGERAAAREPLLRGRELAHHCGADTVVQRATQELLATGARPRSIIRSGAESLTTSERRVAELAASGLTSRAIAEQLFVTQKTVDTHLGNVYRKLDIPGRQHIADALGQRSGIVPDASAGRAGAP